MHVRYIAQVLGTSMLHSFGLNFSQFCGSLAHLALLMYLPGSGTFSIQTFSRHVKNHPRTVEQLLQHHSTIETIRDCVTRICCRIAETAEGTVASVSSKQPPPSSLQPLRATAFVETRDFPSKLLRCATRELMNALVQVRDFNAVASPVSSGLTGMSSLKQSSPEAFYKSRVKQWELKRDTHDALIKLAKQQELEQVAEQCTFVPVVCNSSVKSCVFRKTKEVMEAGIAEGKRIQQQIKDRSGDPFKKCDFQLAKPLPGRRKEFSVSSHLSRYFEGTEAEKHE
jgi:hypothetical protein